jgi:hypothetical protein
MTSPFPTLTAVTVFEGNGSVLVRYEMSGPVPQESTFMVGIHGKSQDGKLVRQFGIKFLEGERAAYFVFDHNAVNQENFDYIRATEDDHQILTPYPAVHFSELGRNPDLRGYLNFDGTDRQTDVRVDVIS